MTTGSIAGDPVLAIQPFKDDGVKQYPQTRKYRWTRPDGSAGSRRPPGWFWLAGGVMLALLVGGAVFVAVEFSAARMLRRESPDLPGIDVSGLDAGELQRLLTKARSEHCPCKCGFTLADCRHKDPTCPLSRPILDGMVRSYRHRKHR